jgi:hypothetical protein
MIRCKFWSCLDVDKNLCCHSCEKKESCMKACLNHPERCKGANREDVKSEKRKKI